MAGCRTRHQSGNDVVGPSAELPQADLPTIRDVLSFGLFLKENSVESKNQISLRELSKKICSDVKQVWARANHKLLAPDVVYLDQNIENKFIEDWKLMGLVKNKKLNKEKRLLGEKSLISCTTFWSVSAPLMIALRLAAWAVLTLSTLPAVAQPSPRFPSLKFLSSTARGLKLVHKGQ